MRYALILMLLAFSLFFSSNPAFAIDECPADTPVTPIVLDELPKDPQQCPPQATCYKKSPQLGSTSYNCFFTTREPETCKPGEPGCSTSNGQQCDTGDNGKIVSKDGDGIMTAIGCIPTEPKALVSGLLRYGTFASGGIALLLMILAALSMITAEGNPDTIKKAQEKFYSAIIGLLLVIFATLLMQVIGVDILGLPGFVK